MSFTQYARLGESCQVSRDTIISNTKYLPQNEPIYYLPYTNMLKYPGYVHLNPLKPAKPLNFEYYEPKPSKCCGYK